MIHLKLRHPAPFLQSIAITAQKSAIKNRDGEIIVDSVGISCPMPGSLTVKPLHSEKDFRKVVTRFKQTYITGWKGNFRLCGCAPCWTFCTKPVLVLKTARASECSRYCNSLMPHKKPITAYAFDEHRR